MLRLGFASQDELEEVTGVSASPDGRFLDEKGLTRSTVAVLSLCDDGEQ